MKRLLALVILATAALAAGLAARADPDRAPAPHPRAAATPTASLATLAAAVVRAGSPGALVFVRSGDGTVSAAFAGAAQLDPRRGLATNDRFRIASITKVFTAALVMQLVDEGRLSLSDPVSRWLPKLLSDGDEISVRELLAHRSGLYDHTDLPEVYNVDRTWRPEQLVALSARQPRSRGFAYSSTNYVVLGLILERVTGKHYAELLRSRITAPLGLTATTYELDAGVSGRHAHGHVPTVHDGFVRPATAAADVDAHSATWGGTAGAIVSTAADVATFLDALLDGKVIPKRRVDEMLPVPRRGERSYGLGLGAFPLACGHGIGHTGNLLGTVTVAYRVRDRTVVAMTNQHPLTNAADLAFRSLVERAACG